MWSWCEAHEKIMLFFSLSLFWPLANSSHRKDSWNCSFTERKKLKAEKKNNPLFSDRFVQIIPIMILLATGRMWLLKTDLWKNSYPQKNTGGLNGSVHNPPGLSPHLTLPPQDLLPLQIPFKRLHICILKASGSESHNPRPQVPLHHPNRLLSWNFETVEAELIQKGINLLQHLQFLEPVIALYHWDQNYVLTDTKYSQL